MFGERLESLERQYEGLEERLADPEVIRNQEEYQKYRKEHAELTPLIQTFRRNHAFPHIPILVLQPLVAIDHHCVIATTA